MLVRFKARNHPQQTANPDVDDRALPFDRFRELDDRFKFTIDVAASEHNAKCDRFITSKENGLSVRWSGERVYCNPPYSNIEPWTVRAWQETEAELIVLLLPANRTEQPWWQKHIEPFRDRVGSRLRTEFLPGRLRFLSPGQKRVGPNERPPFGCVLAIWSSSHIL